MRVLLDECLPAALKSAFSAHAVKTVPETGWRSSKDAPLLDFAEKHFDIFVTIDQNMDREQDLPSRKLGFVIARVRSNRFADFQPILAELIDAVHRVRPGETIRIVAPGLRNRI